MRCPKCNIECPLPPARAGSLVTCGSCQFAYSSVNCPLCRSENVWSHPTVFNEGQVQKCPSCDGSYTLINCATCNEANWFRQVRRTSHHSHSHHYRRPSTSRVSSTNARLARRSTKQSIACIADNAITFLMRSTSQDALLCANRVKSRSARFPALGAV